MNRIHKPAAESPVPLLHNMSVAPRTVISHQVGDRRTYGKGRAFRMPDLDGSLNSARILALLDGSPAKANGQPTTAPTDQEADQQLRERINAHALTLPLPPAAVITDSSLTGDEVCQDLLSVVTVLAKSSSHVYLRDKQPNLAAIRPGRRVVVLIPPQGSLP
jgi:hypothetical protein